MRDWDRKPNGDLDVRGLVGWSSFPMPGGRGCMLRLQSAASEAELKGSDPSALQLTLTANQTRLLGEYLIGIASKLEAEQAALAAPAASAGSPVVRRARSIFRFGS